MGDHDDLVLHVYCSQNEGPLKNLRLLMVIRKDNNGLNLLLKKKNECPTRGAYTDLYHF